MLFQNDTSTRHDHDQGRKQGTMELFQQFLTPQTIGYFPDA